MNILIVVKEFFVMKFLLCLSLFMSLCLSTGAFEIIILPNQNTEMTNKVSYILNYIHNLDKIYSDINSTLYIEFIENDDDWSNMVSNTDLPPSAIAYYKPSKQQIYFSRKGFSYSTIVHEYFHHMTRNGFSYIKTDIQNSIYDDYYNYLDNENPTYWMSNYKEFSSTIFSAWFNTLLSLETNKEKTYIYNQDKSKILKDIAPKLSFYLELIYGTQDICKIITPPADSAAWCIDTPFNLDLILLKNPELKLILLLPLFIFVLIHIVLSSFVISFKKYIYYALLVIFLSFIDLVASSNQFIVIYTIPILIMNLFASIGFIIFLVNKRNEENTYEYL